MLVKHVSCATDETITQMVQQQIHLRTWGRIHSLRVEVHSERLVVHGYSPSYYVVQLALAAIREAFPLQFVELNLQVIPCLPEAPEGRKDSPETIPWDQDRASAGPSPGSHRLIVGPS